MCEHSDSNGADGVDCDGSTGHKDNIASDTLSKQTDLQKFATMAGFKNPASAGVSLNILKKKVMGDAGSTKSTPKKAAPKKATPSKRKQAATDSENGDGDEPGESATKKQKMTPKKAGKKEADPQPEGGDDEGTAFL